MNRVVKEHALAQRVGAAKPSSSSSSSSSVATPASARPSFHERPEMISEERSINLFAVLFGLLRKRIKLALVLALAGGALGALAAMAAPSGRFRSEGMIRIRPNVPRILFSNEQNGVMPMFQSFVDSQIVLIRSEQVVTAAMQSAEWQALHPDNTPEAIAQFTDSLEVNRPRKDAELIEVAFSDSKANDSMIAVHAVIDAYRQLYGDPNAESGTTALKILEERKDSLDGEYKKINKQITDIAEGFGTAEIEQLFQFKVQEVNGAQIELRRIERKRRDMETMLQSSTTAPSDITPEMIAINDSLMRSALQQRLEIELKKKQMELTMGARHPNVSKAQAILDGLDAQIERYASIWRSMPAALDENLPSPTALQQLKTREDNSRAEYEKLHAELADLGLKNLKIKDLREKLQTVSKKLDETSQRIEQLDVESAASGRIEVINKGNLPVVREGDKRKMYGGAGGVAGATLGIGIVALIGLLDRRVHNIKDTRDTFGAHHRLLGAVPVLESNGAATAEQSQAAALAVHRIRAMLQLRASLDRRVFTLTSAVAGNGKTSLTSALGLSLAGSDSKTLLIDCDLIGGALSIRTNTVVRRKLGQVCLRQGIINEEQLEKALNIAEHRQCRLGEAMVQLGYLSEPELVQMLTLQSQSAVGLFNVLDGEPLLDCVAASSTPGLYILPLGSSGTRYAAQLSPMSVRRLLRMARQHFDIVLIDTGPILGSLDASIVAAEADEVMLVLSRGDDRFLVHKALDELESLGARVLGMVFNRADDEDVASSGMSLAASTSRPRLTSKGHPHSGGNANGKGHGGGDADANNGEPRLGPIATAIGLASTSARDKQPRLNMQQAAAATAAAATTTTTT